jgi:hypothetical protein
VTHGQKRVNIVPETVDAVAEVQSES